MNFNLLSEDGVQIDEDFYLNNRNPVFDALTPELGSTFSPSDFFSGRDAVEPFDPMDSYIDSDNEDDVQTARHLYSKTEDINENPVTVKEVWSNGGELPSRENLKLDFQNKIIEHHKKRRQQTPISDDEDDDEDSLMKVAALNQTRGEASFLDGDGNLR